MGKPARDEVIEILRANGPLGLHELYKKTQLSITQAALSFDLNYLKNEGKVFLAEGRRWSLTDGSSPAPASATPAAEIKTPKTQEKTEANVASPARPAAAAKESKAPQLQKETTSQTAAGANNKPVQLSATPCAEDEQPGIKFTEGKQADKAEIKFRKEPEPEPFRVAFASDHSLMIQDGAQEMRLSPQKTRVVIEYLDQMLIDRQRRPWYARLRSIFGGAS